MSRVSFLESCGLGRQKEVDAIKELASSITTEISHRLESLIHRIDCNVYEKCGSKFDTIESKVLSTVREELSFIATPLPFKHPPAGHEDLRKFKKGSQNLGFLAELQTGSSNSKLLSPIATKYNPNTIELSYTHTSKSITEEPTKNYHFKVYSHSETSNADDVNINRKLSVSPESRQNIDSSVSATELKGQKNNAKEVESVNYPLVSSDPTEVSQEETPRTEALITGTCKSVNATEYDTEDGIESS